MTHGGHFNEVQAAFHCVTGSNTPALSASSYEAGSRMYMASHLLWKLNKAGSWTALLTHLLNPHGEG